MTNLRTIFFTFLRLGLTSFGGPAVHIGIYQRYLVDELKWLKEERFGELLAFANFLPGPTSSQTGFSIGIERGGLAGGIASQVAFALPSFLIMYGFYYFGQSYLNTPLVTHIIAALKVFAVAVVFDAVLSMARSFCTSIWQQGIAIIIMAFILFGLPIGWQLVCLMVAAIIGWLAMSRPSFDGVSFVGVRPVPLVSFVLLLVFSFITPTLFGNFFKVGTLVFGGGHVVLPLMHQLAAPNMDSDVFLAGYGLAQALPGPMFTLAAYIGANLEPLHSFWAALVATVAIFLPGYLLIWALFRVWKNLTRNDGVKSLLAGVNAAVVGVLAAALINPIMYQSIHGPSGAILAVLAIIGLTIYKLRVFVVLALTVISYLVVHLGALT